MIQRQLWVSLGLIRSFFLEWGQRSWGQDESETSLVGWDEKKRGQMIWLWRVPGDFPKPR